MIGVVPQTESSWRWEGMVMGQEVSREKRKKKKKGFEVYGMAEPGGNAREQWNNEIRFGHTLRGKVGWNMQIGLYWLETGCNFCGKFRIPNLGIKNRTFELNATVEVQLLGGNSGKTCKLVMYKQLAYN